MSDDYEFVARGSLKLKKDNLGISDKRKMKKKQKKIKGQDLLSKAIESNILINENVQSSLNDDETASNINQNNNNQIGDSWMTEAEKKFLAQQEKRQLARVMAKASKTHKQRVEEFNSNLENLSEHYDIPKVSWTK